MRYRLIAAVAAFAALIAPIAKADEPVKDVKGLYLMSDYPAVTLRPGETSSINLRLHNYDLAPERLTLSVSGVPAGWTATLMGGGQPVAAAMPATNASVSLELRLDVPKNAAEGTQTLTVTATGASTNAELPIAVTLAKDLPAKLTLTPQLPELRGTSKSSFEYQLGIKNDSGKKLTVSLAAQVPQNFDASFTEGYGSQELNAVPVDAGQTKDVKLKVTPAEHGRRRQLQNRGAGRRRRCHGDGRAYARHHRAAEARGQRPRRPCLDARRGRQGDQRAGRHHQHRHRTGRRGRAERLGAERLEGHVRSEDRRAHRAEREQGSAGADHADRQGDRRRLCDHDPRLEPRRVGDPPASASR